MKRIIKKRIYYFHGFKSAGGGNKFETLKKVYGKEYEIFSPTLPNNVYEARSELRLIAKEFKENDEVTVIGTSLGAFYAYYFAGVLFSSGAILINPVLDPELHMRKYLGKNKNFKTGEEFDFTEQDLIEFEYMKKEMDDADACFTATQIALGKNDDFIDVEKVAEWFHDEYNVKFFDDDHRLNLKFEEMLREERTRAFIKKPWFFWDTGLLEELEETRDNPEENKSKEMEKEKCSSKNKYYTLEDIEKKYNISRSDLRRKIKEGKLKVIKGKKRFFTVLDKDLKEFLKS